MKKIALVCLLVVLLLTIPVVALGLNSPSISEGHGVITGTFMTNNGLVIRAEYGLTSDLAIFGSFGVSSAGGTKLGAKYELNPTLAVTGGVIDFSLTNPFLGINAAAGLGKKLSALGEVDFSLAGSKFILTYEAGLKFNLDKQLDLRGGVIGSTAGSGVGFELGMGYKF